MNELEQDRNWRLEKKIPIALIVTIFVMIGTQTATTVWWASSISARVDYLERQMTDARPQGDRLTRVEVRLETVQSGVEEIKRILQRDPPRP